MTSESLETAQRLIAMRLSTHHPADFTWTEWTTLIARRTAVVDMYWGERPSTSSVAALAADVTALLVAVIASEDVDIAAEDAA